MTMEWRIRILGPAALCGGLIMGALASNAYADGLSDGIAHFEQRDYQSALELLRPLADEGEPRAQYVIAVMFLNGLIKAPSEDTAAGYMHRAADQGYAPAQTELARMYRDGDGVPQHPLASLEWYQRAAENGDVGAQLTLADAYAYGSPPQLIEAYKWYEIAIRYWGPLAVRAREVVAEQMTPEQIAQATKLAGDWLKTNQQ